MRRQLVRSNPRNRDETVRLLQSITQHIELRVRQAYRLDLETEQRLRSTLAQQRNIVVTSLTMPWIHTVYQQVLEKICKHLPHLQQPFPSSVFAAATFNFGPNAVCNSHVDHLNWASGICAITSGGNYDFKLVGHLVLYDPKLIIEFLSD